MKKCIKCGETKSLESFFKNRRMKDGHFYYCKDCESARNAVWKTESRAVYLESKDKDRKKNIKRYNDASRAWREVNREKVKRNNLWHAFGITLEQYDEMSAKQSGVCAICSKKETKVRAGTLCSLSIDHCHDTNVIRGLLCNNCNRALGLLRDDPTVLRKAADYLESRRGDT